MTTRAEVERAVSDQDSRLHLIVSNANGRCVAERQGDGHSGATLIVLGLAEKIEAGKMTFAARPEQPAGITAALKRCSKKERAKNRRAAKQKVALGAGTGDKTAPSGQSAHTRTNSETSSRRPAILKESAAFREPEPPPEPMPGQTSMRLGVV